MRPWLELRAAFAEDRRLIELPSEQFVAEVISGADVQTDDAEHWAACLACLLIENHKGPVMVPKSWARTGLHPAACVLAAALKGQGPWTGRIVMEPFGLSAACEVAGEIFRAAFDDCLLRPASPVLGNRSGDTETRIEAVVHPGPRLLASIGEERERWETIW